MNLGDMLYGETRLRLAQTANSLAKVANTDSKLTRDANRLA